MREDGARSTERFEDALAAGDAAFEQDDPTRAAAAWRKAAAGATGPKETWKVHRRLRKLGDPGGDPVRVAFLGDSTLEFAAAHLETALFREGYAPSTYVAPIGQAAREILDPSSRLHAFGADLVICDVRGESLFPQLYASRGGAAGADPPEPEPTLDEYAGQIRALAGGPAFVLVHGFVVPALPPDGPLARWNGDGCARRVQRLTERLAGRLADLPTVRVFDMDGFAARVGKDRLCNRKMWHLGKVAVDEAHLGALAEEYLRTVVPLTRAPRKVLVLDLDNTLWGGVLGEAGADGIALAPDGPGAPFVEFQRECLHRLERGTALALCSKNNEEDVLPVLREHPSMVLRPEHIAAHRINWTDKVENLKAIAAEINVGTDALVFLDDNPVERENVRMRLPEVLVPELPADPVDYAPFLARLSGLDPLRLTGEDLARGKMYAEEKRRRTLRDEAPDLESYLGTLETVVSVHVARPGEIARVQQLLGKTNQFNTTTLRWDVPEVERFVAGGGRVHVAHVRDRFGDSGLTGVCLSRRDGDAVEIADFLLSCRVLGRGVEDAFLRTVAAEWADEGARTVAGQIVFTPKNPPVRGLFDGNGFRKVQEDVKGHRWEADTGDVSREPPPWIRVELPARKGAEAN